jgi:hypothetical protein
MPELDALDLQAKVAKVLDRWPSAGLAVGVIRDGSLEWFFGHGLADIKSKEPITQDTVFRIGSITKAQVLVEDWRIEDNPVRPHSALGYLTPTDPAKAWTTHHPELS